MKDVLRSMAMAFAMFSRFPVPHVAWKKENMRYMLACLPIVGAAVGGVCALWWYVCCRLSFGILLFAAGMTALPLLLTGGIHMDGFMDTVDALASHGDTEKKRAILKDPHTGAFAVLYGALYLLVTFALFAESGADMSLLLPVCLVPVLSRCGSAMASLLFPVYGGEGLLKTFHEAGDKKAAAVPALIAAAALVPIILRTPVTAAACLVAEGICMLYVYRVSKKQLGGMSGDLSGFLLQLSEAVLLFMIILGKAVMA